MVLLKLKTLEFSVSRCCKDGMPRFLTNYRNVNAITVPDSYPLLRMDDCIDVGNAKVVSKLDLLKGYWQVPLTDRVLKMSAFVTPDYLPEYIVMAFGMCNAPATFQWSGVGHCTSYLDDIVGYTQTWEEHLQVLEQVIAQLSNANLTPNLVKCDFSRVTITYLRHVGWEKYVPSVLK